MGFRPFINSLAVMFRSALVSSDFQNVHALPK
jgi:hypothetical protein